MSRPLFSLSPSECAAPDVTYVPPLVDAGTPPCTPPLVDAGIDQSIDVYTGVLSGSASSPCNLALTYLWQQVSGPSQTSFSTPTQASTQFTFSAYGQYVYKLVVTDSQGNTAFDYVTVNSSNNIDVSFDAHDGDVAFPSGAFESYYLTASMDGDTASKFASYGNNPNDGGCESSGAMSSPTAGVCAVSFSGQSTYNSGTGLYTSTLAAAVAGNGDWLNRNTYFPAPASIDITGDTPSQILSGIAAIGGSITNQFTDTIQSGDRKVVSYSSLTDNGPGFFVVARGGVIWCPGNSYAVTYSNRATWWGEGYAVSRSGESARTQEITGYNSGTNTYSGSMSRTNFSFTSPGSRASVLINYTVTPSSGAAYTISEQYSYTSLTPGQQVTDQKPFPVIVGAVVYAQTVSIFFYDDVSNDFGGYADGFYTYLEGAPSWASSLYPVDNFPNAFAWSDFAGLPDGRVETCVSGSGFYAAITATPSLDYVQAYDDFEAYSEGTTSVLGAGYGFIQARTFVSIYYPDANQTFDSETPGSYSQIAKPADPVNRWAAAIKST